MPVLDAVSSVVSALELLFKAAEVAPSLAAKLGRYKSKPSADDRKVLVAFAKLIDERRVFHAPFNSEVFEACLGSVSYVKDRTEEALTRIEHPGADAVLGAMLDDLRRFMDAWRGRQTPRGAHDRWAPPGPHRGEGREEIARFFEDLGWLRSRVALWMGALHAIEPKAVGPRGGS